MKIEKAIEICETMRDEGYAVARRLSGETVPTQLSANALGHKSRADALSTLLQTVRDYKEMEDAADQVRKLDDGGGLRWSLEKFPGHWQAWTHPNPASKRYDSLLEAFSEVRGGR